MGEYPKRRKDKYNPYTIYEKEGKYYIIFKDSHGQRNCLEVEKELYEAFNDFELEDLSYLNVWDRHMEQSEVWESTLNERAVESPETVEEIVFRNIQDEKIYKAIKQLSKIQQCRVWKYFFEDMTLEQIAREEGCSKVAVKYSIDRALEMLRRIVS